MPTQFLYPRPEYPRPDRRRGSVEGYDWLNLNGPWQFRFDPDKSGIEQRWFAPDQPPWHEQIIVPFCWESLAAWGEGGAAGNDHYYSTRVFRNPLEVTRENHRSAKRYEVGWYRRDVVIPDNPAWRGKRTILTIGAADFFTDAWCNGVHLGHHEGGYTPFEFDLTDALESGGDHRACLVLRVEDPMENHEQPVGKQWRWYTTTSGIWQTIFVEPRSQRHVASFRIVTDIESGTARFSVKLDGPAQTGEKTPNSVYGDAKSPKNTAPARISDLVEAEISLPDTALQTVTLETRGDSAEAIVAIKPLRFWDPNSPELYNVTLRLRRGTHLLDTVYSYFGMRKIDFAFAPESGTPAALRLNNVARYLRGALYQSYFPDGVYTASSVEVLKSDITFAKRAGFNFLRIHIKVDDPLLYYWADKLGILLMADFPNFGEGGDTPPGRRRFEAMLRETLVRDFNHPSIIAWCLFNETWGFGGQASFQNKLLSASTSASAENSGDTAASTKTAEAISATATETRPQEWVQQMWELAKELDPTRLIEDMSVCHWEHLEYYQHCNTDINSWHFYIHDYARAREHVDKVVRSTFVGSSFNYVPGFQHKGQPLINSEYGGIGALDGDRDVSWSFKFLTNELRRHQQIAAYIYTELHDVEWEYNGFLNYDRTPKEFGYDPRMLNESNTLPMDCPPVIRVAPGEVARIPVASSHYSTRAYENVSLHWMMGAVDTLGRLHQDVARGHVPIEFPHRKVLPAHTIEWRAPDFPMLGTLVLSARSNSGEVLAQNFVHVCVSAGYPPPKEELPRSLVVRTSPGDWSQAAWSRGASERDSAREQDSCFGSGSGFFEWILPVSGCDLSRARRIKFVCEASSHRVDHPQTDADICSTPLEITLNDVRIYVGVLRNHPHDARGVLSYLRGGFGAYGYLVHAFVEGELLARVLDRISDGCLRLRCAIPADAMPAGGLTIYGAECGRFPVAPTLIIEW